VADLLFEPVGAVTLRSADGKTAYSEGRDFRRVGRRLHLLPGTRVPFKTASQLLLPPGSPQSIGAATDGKHHLFFSEGHVWHDLQAAASYRHRGGWSFPAPRSAARSLPNTRRLIRERRPLRFTALGDSITAGGNASGRTGAPPFLPAWPELVTWGITDRTRTPVQIANLAVGGMSSPWGVEQVDACAKTSPDLMAIAFGMNDASGRRPVAEFADNVKRILDGVRSKAPQCEFVLVAGMTGNPEWTASAPALYPAYRDALAALTGPGIALADVTAAWDALCARKKWRDFTGNGVNHPNDFGHRLYAQVFLATVGVA
ncbi:MAG: SGNH/GDSL hydrolase family protein, partial [Armatimonadaceae bacterium]